MIYQVYHHKKQLSLFIRTIRISDKHLHEKKTEANFYLLAIFNEVIINSRPQSIFCTKKNKHFLRQTVKNLMTRSSARLYIMESSS